MTITESHATTAPASWRARTAFGWILVTSLVIALVAPPPYLTTSLVDVVQEQSDLPIARNDVERPFALHLAGYVHAGFGGLALSVSPLQVIRPIRMRAPRVRRVIGRIALVPIAVAGPGALTLVPLQPGRDSRSSRLRRPRRVLARLCCHRLPCDSPGDVAKQRRWALSRPSCQHSGGSVRHRGTGRFQPDISSFRVSPGCPIWLSSRSTTNRRARRMKC